MSAASKITNVGPVALPLPWPLAGVLRPGQGVVVGIASALLLAAVPGLGAAMRVDDMPPTYAGPIDSSFQGSLNANGTVTQTMSASAQFWVDPANGLDTNPGTLAAPFKSLDGGLMPAVLALRYCDVTATYIGTTTDPQPAGKQYRLPIGVNLTLKSPWTDIGLGTRTVAGGTTSTSIVDSVGSLTVDIAEGSRLRWLTGANAGQTYTVASNSASAFALSLGGFESAGYPTPTVGDTFVLERPTGGLSQADTANNIDFDCSAPGAGFGTAGFKITQVTNFPVIRVHGGVQRYEGLFVDCGASGAGSLIPLGAVECVFGRAQGAALLSVGSTNQMLPIGFRGIGCYFRSTAGGGFQVACSGCVVTEVNSVFRNSSWASNLNPSEFHHSPRLNGISSNRTFMIFTECGSVFFNKPLVLACTQVPFRAVKTAQLHIQTIAFENTTTAVGITGVQSRISVTNITGTIGGAVVLQVSDGSTVDASGGGNTGVGSSNAVTLGGNAAAAWPAGGTLTTDLGAGSPQMCLMRS